MYLFLHLLGKTDAVKVIKRLYKKEYIGKYICSYPIAAGTARTLFENTSLDVLITYMTSLCTKVHAPLLKAGPIF